MSVGQGGGAVAGAVIGTILFPGVGTFLGMGIGTLVGASLGMALGGMIDPPRPDAITEPSARDIRVNTFDRSLPVPVVIGTSIIGGNVIFIGKVWKKKKSHGGGKGDPEVVSIIYNVDFAVCLGEGEIQDVLKVWKGEEEVTDEEGELWDWRAGTGTQVIPDEVTEVQLENPVPWEWASYLMWHGEIGEMAYLPTIVAEVEGYDCETVEEDTLGSPHTLTPEAVQWDASTHRIHILESGTSGMTTLDRLSAQKVETELPVSLSEVYGFGVWNLEQIAFFLGQVDGSYDRFFALGAVGMEAGDSNWIEDQLNLPEWGLLIDCYTMDQKWGRFYAVVRDAGNSKVYVLKIDLTDLTEAKWQVPGRTPSNFIPTAVHYDQEFDEVYICGHDPTVGEFVFGKAEFGATSFEERAISDGLLGIPAGFGRSGDYIFGVDKTNEKLFRFAWDDLSLYVTSGIVGDPRSADGQLTDVLHADYAQEIGRICVLDDIGSGAWAVVMTEYGAQNWSFVANNSYKRTLFSRLGCGAGAIHAILTNTRFGGRLSEDMLDLESFDQTAGYLGELVRNGVDASGNIKYENRWTTNLTMLQRRKVKELLRDILDTFAGHLVWQNGKLRLLCERPIQRVAYRAGHVDIDEGSFSTGATERTEVLNSVRVDFVDSAEEYRHDFAQANAEWDQERWGELRQAAFKINGITNRHQALRMAGVMLHGGLAHRCLVGAKLTRLHALGLLVGDGISFDHDLSGWDGEKLFRLIESRETPDHLVEVVTIEHEPTIYQTPKETDYQGGDFGLGNPGESDSTTNALLLPPIRFRVFEDRMVSRVVMLFSIGNLPEEIQWAQTAFEVDEAIDGAFNTLVCLGKVIAWSAYLAADINDTDAEIFLLEDTLFGSFPAKNANYLPFYLDGELILGGTWKSGPVKWEDCTRGEYKTTAAAATIVTRALARAYRRYEDGVEFQDITTIIASDITTFTEYLLDETGDEFYLGFDYDDINAIVFGVYTDGTKMLVEWWYSADDNGTWVRLPGVIDNTHSFTKDFKRLCFDPPYDWTPTAKHSATGKFADTTPRYYLKAVQVKETTRGHGAAIKTVVAKAHPVVLEYLPEQTAMWRFKDAEVFKTWYIRATAVSTKNERSDTAQSPILSLLVQDLGASVPEITQLRAWAPHMGPLPPVVSSPKVKVNEDVTFHWNLDNILGAGFGKFPFGQSPPGYGGARPRGFTSFDYEVDVGAVIVRSGSTTDFKFIYRSADNIADNTSFQQVFTFRVRARGHTGLVSGWVELQTAAL